MAGRRIPRSAESGFFKREFEQPKQWQAARDGSSGPAGPCRRIDPSDVELAPPAGRATGRRAMLRRSRHWTSPCRHCHGTGLEPPVVDGKAIVAAIVGDFGLSFTTGELLRYAHVTGGALLTLLDGHDVRSIGWALRAVEGADLGGYQLERQGQDRNRVALWRVVILPVS
jgi:hypothetical protein